MKRIDAEMQKFREVSCFLWNSYVMPGRHVLRLDIEESFEIIERELLRCFAFSDMSYVADMYRKQPIDCLAIKLAENIAEAAIQAGDRDENKNIVWKDAEIYCASSLPELRFFDFFDWDHYGPISYELVRAVDVKTKRLFLIPQEFCSFWLLDFKKMRDT